MVAANISHEKIAAGRKLVERLLNQQPQHVRAALWIFFTDANSWKLGLAFDEEFTAKAGYRMALKAHASEELTRNQIALEELFVFRGLTPFLKTLGMMVSTGDAIADITFSGNVINGQVMPDCHIYYLNLPPKKPRR